MCPTLRTVNAIQRRSLRAAPIASSVVVGCSLRRVKVEIMAAPGSTRADGSRGSPGRASALWPGWLATRRGTRVPVHGPKRFAQEECLRQAIEDEPMFHDDGASVVRLMVSRRTSVSIACAVCPRSWPRRRRHASRAPRRPVVAHTELRHHPSRQSRGIFEVIAGAGAHFPEDHRFGHVPAERRRDA